MVGKLKAWADSSTNWRIIAGALEKETLNRSQGETASDGLRKAVSEWSDPKYIVHIERLLEALDQVRSPQLDKEQCMDLIHSFVIGDSSIPDDIMGVALEQSLRP